MNPMFIVAIPIVLVIIGMVLNSTGLSFDQPPSSSEQDPAKRSAAEADAYRRFFDRQRKQAVQRQARVGQERNAQQDRVLSRPWSGRSWLPL